MLTLGELHSSSVHGSMYEHGSWLSSEQSRKLRHAETFENSKCMRHALWTRITAKSAGASEIMVSSCSGA